MSAAQHTPGPWFFEAIDYREKTGPEIWIRPTDSPLQSLASVRAGSIDNGLPLQTKANALLIAAAPDLLEALKGLFEISNGLLPMGSLKEKVGAAIAKAEGRES